MGISTSAAADALFSPPRINTTSRSIFSRPPPLPRFLRCFIFHSIAILFPCYRSFSREPSFFSRGVSFVPLLSFLLSLSPACAFLKGEGARPGAAVSNKYDTGIGYKETINHPSGREWDLVPRGLLSGKFLRGYLWPDEKKERSRNLPKIVQVPRKPSYERVIRIARTEAGLLPFSSSFGTPFAKSVWLWVPVARSDTRGWTNLTNNERITKRISFNRQ